jgi:Zn-finger nucleic acid-binding protein
MAKIDNCPHCGVSLIGDPIPEDIRHHYSPPYYWRREIGIEYPEKCDGVWEWQCPDCKGTWLSEVGKLKNENR